MLWIPLAKTLKSLAGLQQVCKGVMSKAKWFVARKPSTGEIIAKSADQIVPQKISLRYKNVVLYSESPDPPFSSWRVEGGSRYETRVVVTRQALQSETTAQEPGLFSYA